METTAILASAGLVLGLLLAYGGTMLFVHARAETRRIDAARGPAPPARAP